MAFFAAYVHYTCSYMSRFAPASRVHTLADLQHEGIPLTRAITVPHLDGHLCVFSDKAVPWWILNSGPPAYHFDANGRLVDFTLDDGDSTKFQQEYGIYQGTEISMEDLPAIFSRIER